MARRTSTSGMGRSPRLGLALAVAGGSLLAAGLQPVYAQSSAASTVRVSVSSVGGQAGADSYDQPDVSADGRLVVFSSAAALVPADTNRLQDVYVRDLVAGTTRRVSAPWSGRAVGGNSSSPAISDDGHYAAFVSSARHLVPGDEDRVRNVFVRDLRTATTVQVDVGMGGASADGDSRQDRPSLSSDGRYVLFGSAATNLVPGDTNASSDTFVRDLVAGTTRRVDLSSTGAQADDDSSFADLSADAGTVAFSSAAGNLVPGDTNGLTDVFVRDLSTGVTRRESVPTAGGQTSGSDELSYLPSLSGDGALVAFISRSNDLVPGDDSGNYDVFLRDRTAGTTTLVSRAFSGAASNGSSFEVSLSTDGRLLTYESNSSDLVRGDTDEASDVFVHDLGSGVTTRASLTGSGGQADNNSYLPSISATGRFVVFTSFAALVSTDTNARFDAYLRDRGA